MAKIKRDIKYVNKDFGEYRQSLINYARNYFPDTYSDFNEASPGMMFIEMASYLGDVLSYYTDVQLQESLLATVDENKNLYNIAQALGYKATPVTPAIVDLEVFQVIPAIGEGEATRPDYDYAVTIQNNMVVSTVEADGPTFITQHPVDFAHSGSFDPTEVSVYQVSDTGQIERYLLKKKVRAVSGEIITENFVFDQPKPYDKIVLQNTNISGIIDIYDSDDNQWHEVKYLAQDLVAIPIKNTNVNIPRLSQYRSTAPYILHWKQTERRFVTRLRADGFIELQFGGGVSSEADEEIVPNPFNVALGIDYFERATDVSIDPMNFLYTRMYGTAPSNTTLTIRYATAAGITDNAAAQTLTVIDQITVDLPTTLLNQIVYQEVVDSIAVNNPAPAMGGSLRNPTENLRQDAMANFAAQNRCVTIDDYRVRCHTMPPQYGAVSKVYVEQDTQVGRWNEGDRIPNPYALNLYVLCQDDEGSFVQANEAIKHNLQTHLAQYRMLTDGINIKDPFIVNIGVDFELIVRPTANSNDVLLRCVDKMRQLLHNSKMEISMPILVSKLYTELDSIEGVQTVQNIQFTNLYNQVLGYSNVRYDLRAALRDGILYPSVDPMIFEVKYPTRDIRGRVNNM